VVDLNELATQTQKYFNLTLPIKLVDLKKAYRRVSFECHPDHGGDEEHFKAMQGIYHSLILQSETPEIFGEGERENVIQITTNGTPLYELGLGLGPTINGRDCEECDHKGYEIRYGMHYIVCEKCDANGMIPRVSPCRACNGSGEFTQDYTRRVVECRLCKGSGVFRHPYARVLCTSCWGTKTIHTTSEDKGYYETCYKCHGKGEIEIHNPVLPKGALVGRK